MGRKYELVMDYPYTELEELGYAKSRLLRGITPGPGLRVGAACMLEPRTGTLMLKPKNLDPIKWYSTETDDLRLTSSLLTVNPAYWRSDQQVANIMGSPVGGSHEWQHAGGFTLLSSLAVMASTSLASAIVSGGRELVPILATTNAYPINQGWHITFQTYGYPATMARNYMAVRFADFLLNLHTDGGAELFWSRDGSGDSDKWIRRKVFDEFGGNPKGMTTNLLGAGPQAAIHLYIMPFGRGNILFMIKSGGKTFSDVYHHPYATEEDGNYSITKAGKCAIYVDGNDSHACSVKLAKIGYATMGAWRDEALTLPYAPTVTPESVLYWCLAGGDPATTYAQMVLDVGESEYVPFVANGIARRCTPVIQLHGDGVTTPFVDGYQVKFPEKFTTYTPKQFTIDHAQIASLAIEDGPELDDQKLTVKLYDNGDDDDITNLCRRGRIHGKLRVTETKRVINSEGKEAEQTTTKDIMRAMFVEPRRTIGRGGKIITLAGVNYGAFKLGRKKFFWPRSYGGLTHPDAVRELLKACGFPATEIEVTADTLRLPETSLEGSGVEQDPGTTPIDEEAPPAPEAAQKNDFKSQPDLGSSVREYLEHIVANYSADWGISYDADGVWRYGPSQGARAVPASSSGTIIKEPSHAQITGGQKPWYADEVEEWLEPAEANMVYMVGQTDAGSAIGNYAINPKSIKCEEGEKPLSYLGHIEPIIFVDTALNTQEVLDACLNHVAAQVFKPRLMRQWKGPYNPALAKGTRWTMEGLGDVVIRELNGDGDSPRKLECTESVTYIGEVVV